MEDEERGKDIKRNTVKVRFIYIFTGRGKHVFPHIIRWNVYATCFVCIIIFFPRKDEL